MCRGCECIEQIIWIYINNIKRINTLATAGTSDADTAAEQFAGVVIFVVIIGIVAVVAQMM